MLSQAVFLVGGLGTRLGSLTRETPKPLLPVGGRPFLDYLVETAARFGLDRIVLLCGYRAEAVASHYPVGRHGGITVDCVVEPAAAGTAGALRHAAPLLDETFLLANGDTLFDFNWLDLTCLPADSEWVARLALRVVRSGHRYGGVSLDGSRIRAFSPPTDRPGPINGGVYLMRRGVLDWIDGQPCSLEADVFPRLAEAGRLQGRVYDGWFIDIGVPDDYARAQTEVPARLTRPAVFFDRDGVLNLDRGFVHRPDQFAWVEGAREAIKLCNDRGWLVFVVTNQSGVARGFYGEETVRALHRWMQAELAKDGAHVDAFEFCPHHPDGTVEAYRRHCHRRKPGPGMIHTVLDAWPVDAGRSFLVGDNDSDVAAAVAAGIAGHRFGGGNLLDLVAPLVAPAAR